MKKIWNSIQKTVRKCKTELSAFFVIFLLSLIMILAGLRFYHQYRKQVIETEESQLLTIAGIIGNNLNTYLEQQLHQIDLYYAEQEAWNVDSTANPETAGNEEAAEVANPETTGNAEAAENTEIAAISRAETELLERQTEYFLQENQMLYNWISITAPGETVTFYKAGETEKNAAKIRKHSELSKESGTENREEKKSEEKTGMLHEEKAWISGKKISDETGWYELYVEKEIPRSDGMLRLTFAMNLESLYQKIVAPVKIGKAGYSSVKDQNMYIIMHHAKDQIGLEAFDDRIQKYPELDMSSMNAWLSLQAKQDFGTGVVDTYVWDDPELPKVRRVVAFQSILVQGERWIVNSTIPVKELSGPLDSMMVMLTGIVALYVLSLIIATVVLLRNHFLAQNQQKEITYLKEINQGMEMLAQKNNEIRHYQRVQSLGMMASHIAHEFNNYLTPVLIYAELLENDTSISAENQEMIHEITEAVDKASNLSKELLAFSRQDTGVRLELIDFTKEVQNAVTIIKQLTPSAIILKTEITKEPLYVLGRKKMAEHILMNLCKNAFQAMEKSEKKELVIRLMAKNPDMLILEVADSGCGIKDDAMQKIFEPFYTTRGSRQGTGLGLSVVQNMVTSVGGNIRVESKADEGTTFVLEIPQSRSEEEKDSRKRLQQVSRIAIVSQDESMKTWKKTFARSQKTIELYGHPAVVIDRIQKNPSAYNLIIAEYSLPVMNGIELCEAIRRINPETRLILIADQNGADFEWYLNNGMIDRFMLKETFLEEFSEMFGYMEHE